MTLGRAISIASKAHQNQFDKAGEPYILHPLAVMQDVMHKEDKYKIVAILHDVIEDTSWFLETSDENCIYDFAIANPGIGPIEISEEIYQALKLLTHEKYIPYQEYIVNLSNNIIATRIKLADLKHNSDIMRLKGIEDKDQERIKKYHTAFLFLTGKYNKLKAQS